MVVWNPLARALACVAALAGCAADPPEGTPPTSNPPPVVPSGVAFTSLPCKQVIDDALCELDLPLTGSYQNPAWSPDARRLVVTHFADGYNLGAPALEVIDLATGARAVIGSGVNLPGSSNTWNPAGKIVYAHEPTGTENVLSDAQGSYTVSGEQGYVSSADGNLTPSPITNNPADAWEPSLSPAGVWTKGTWVVFQDRYDAHILVTEVFADYRVPRSPVQIDISDGRLAAVKQPVWSTDGRHIVYQGQTSGGAWTLELVDVPQDPALMAGAGASFTRPLAVAGSDPSFSPDGRWIVYSGGETAQDTLWIVDVPASGSAPAHAPVKVTPASRTTAYEGAPGWSSDGGLVAFESSPGSPEAAGARTTIWIARAPRLP